MHPFQGSWGEFQERFRTQFSKLGNTREQLFHAWRSIQFDKNVETINVYAQRIRQIADKLSDGELQIKYT